MVVFVGDTVCVPLADTVPTPGLMEMDVAPLTSHCNVAGCPDVIDEELVLNDVTTGNVNHVRMAPSVARAKVAIVPTKISNIIDNITIRPTEWLFCGNVLRLL